MPCQVVPEHGAAFPVTTTRRQARGFTLIEVMMAAAIFAAGLAAVFSAFSTAALQFEHQRNTTQAIHVAEAVLEELLLRAPTDPDIAQGVTRSSGYDNNGTPATSGFFTVSWVVTAGPLAGVRHIAVTSTWAERGVAQHLSFSTDRN